jgi:serine/arginine repetitive matrix protein 2
VTSLLESALDYQKPLSSISASESAPSKHVDRSSYAYTYDSIIGGDYQRSFLRDSFFNKTGNTSMSAGSVFGNDDYHPPHGNFLPPNQFRPISMFSFIVSIVPTKKTTQ